MSSKPDLIVTTKALLDELEHLPGSEKAIRHTAALVTLLARRTKYLQLRAGLVTTLLCLVSLAAGNYMSNGNADIPAGKLIVAVVTLALALGVVSLLDYRLQRRPVETEDGWPRTEADKHS